VPAHGEPAAAFALVQVQVRRIDWLDVGVQPHRRCVLVDDGAGWVGRWVAP
jgi:hypothetical protein